MIGENKTRFAAIGFQQAHRDGPDMAVVAVRARYDIQGHELVLSAHQQLVLVDQYRGDPHKTPLMRAADLVPFKPNTDVTMLADSYRPDDGGIWLSGMRVNSKSAFVRIEPEQRWVRRGRGWSLEVAEQSDKIHLGFEDAPSDAFEDEAVGSIPFKNPIGIRRRNPDLPLKQAYKVPRILPRDAALTSPDDEVQMVGFAPIPPFWRHRQQFAGTYDDPWLSNRHPRLPEDFDYRFYQCAHPMMIQDGYLRGGERVEAIGVTADGEDVAFDLPRIQPIAHYLWVDGRNTFQKLNLDGVHLNLLSGSRRVEITWRGWLPMCPQFFKIDLFSADVDDPQFADIPFCGLNGLAEAAE